MIPPEGLAVQFWVESQYNRNIVSPVGAKGVAQFMPLTGAAYGLVTGVTPAMEKEYKARYSERRKPITRCRLLSGCCHSPVC